MTEEFETAEPDDPPVSLTSVFFADQCHRCLDVGANPRLAVDRVELCRPGAASGSMQIITGDRMQSVVTFAPDEFERLVAWLGEHVEDEYVRMHEEPESGLRLDDLD